MNRKRFFCCALGLAVCRYSFGQNGLESIDTWFTAMTWILILGAVLNAMLFYKIWMMTNDVKRITVRLEATEEKTVDEGLLSRLLLEGKKEEAYHYLNRVAAQMAQRNERGNLIGMKKYYWALGKEMPEAIYFYESNTLYPWKSYTSAESEKVVKERRWIPLHFSESTMNKAKELVPGLKPGQIIIYTNAGVKVIDEKDLTPGCFIMYY